MSMRGTLWKKVDVWISTANACRLAGLIQLWPQLDICIYTFKINAHQVVMEKQHRYKSIPFIKLPFTMIFWIFTNHKRPIHAMNKILKKKYKYYTMAQKIHPV